MIILSPTPDGVVDVADAHPAADLQLQGTVDGAAAVDVGPRAGAAASPQLRQDFGEAAGEVVWANTDFADGPDCSVEQALSVVEIDVAGEEAVEQLQ